MAARYRIPLEISSERRVSPLHNVDPSAEFLDDPLVADHGSCSHSGRLWLVTVPAMVLPFLAALFYFVLLREHWLARAVYGGTKLFTVVWPALALTLVCRASLSLRPAHPWSVHWKALPLGVVSGLAIVALMFVLAWGPLAEMLAASTEKIRDKVSTLGVLEHYWLFGAFIALIHSAIEEYYWRWFVYGRLRKALRPARAHAWAGIAFSAHHIVVASQFFGLGWGFVLGGLVGVGGVIWSLMYARQQTLAGAWVSHIIVDLGILIVGHRLLFGSCF